MEKNLEICQVAFADVSLTLETEILQTFALMPILFCFFCHKFPKWTCLFAICNGNKFLGCTELAVYIQSDNVMFELSSAAVRFLICCLLHICSDIHVLLLQNKLLNIVYKCVSSNLSCSFIWG